MKHLTVFSLLLTAVVTASALDKGTIINGDEAKKIDDYMSVCEGANRFSGVVLAAKNGKIIFRKAYGKANYQFDVPNTSNDKFRIASMTKAFTAMAVMQLKEKGLLDTSDKLSKYLPQFKNGDKITLQDLLRMNSGIEEFTELPDFENEIAKKHLRPLESIALVQDKALLFKPGTQYAYSNINYVILAYIVEKVSGIPYGEFLKKNVLEKADLKNTGIVSCDKVIDRLSYPYALDYFDEVQNASFIDMSIPFGSGDMYSTVDDLFAWDRILYTDKLLSRKYMDEIFSSGTVPTTEKKDSFFCYGWVLQENTDYGKTYLYQGAINGGGSWISRFVDNDAVLIILTNFEDVPLYDISADLSAIIFGRRADLPVFHRVAKLKEETLKKYLGKYKFENGLEFEFISRNGFPYLKAGKTEQAIFPENETSFYFKGELNACLTFSTKNGKAMSVTFTQGKTKTSGLKIDE